MSDNENKVKQIPILNIKMMTDEEWNKLAYRNWLERNGSNGEYSSSK